MNLFNKKILNQRIASYSFPAGEKLEAISKLITGWQKALKDSDLSKTKEKSIQGKFLNVFFEQILGYEDKTGGKDQWTLIAEPKTEVDAQTADGSIGFFSKEQNTTVGVIELKDAKTSLDKKQSGREKGYSPIEQAYLYATKFDRCKWIIVSNFREIRLYNKSRSEQFFEKFDVLELHKEDEFKKFFFLLNIENLISIAGESPIDDLAKKSEDSEEDISKKFYSDYKKIRYSLINDIDTNQENQPLKVLARIYPEKKQPENDYPSLEYSEYVYDNLKWMGKKIEMAEKILNRIVFILFCEDTANLLPKNILVNTYKLGKSSRQRSDEKIWLELKNLFMDIDEGRNDIEPKINGYNGGLFKFDKVLDNLSIKDSIWEEIIELSKYDFESDLNVNVLGHIFEQSIDELEEIKLHFVNKETGKLEAEGKAYSPKSKRKKDGIFYTPEYITKYIVENTVGKYLEEHPDKLETIKILDPACGSGAFLNQAHSFLQNEYKVRHEQKMIEKQEKGEAITLFDYNPAEANRAILLNNLYGVDLNDESVEITKLSLWLKTARKDEPLQNLDGNIKVGNSLIDDPEVAGNKAFKWEEKFNQISLKRKISVYIDQNVDRKKITTLQKINSKIDFIQLENHEQPIKNLIKAISAFDWFDSKSWQMSWRTEQETEVLIKNLKKLNLSPSDALHLACALNNYCEIFLTDDRDFHKIKYTLEDQFPEIKILGMDEFYNYLSNLEVQFDVLIGNPPYVRQELFKEIKPHLQKNYKTYTGVSDLYVYFFEQGLNLMQDGGYFAFIVSDKFTRANYGRPLRKWLTENFTIVEYVKSFGEQVFEGVTVDPCIIIIKKEKPKHDSQVKVTDFKSMIEVSSFYMNQSELTEEPWNFVNDAIFKLKAKIESKGTKIKDLEGVKINYGIKTGFNEAFIIDEAKKNDLILKDPKSAEIIKPLLRGRDLKRYSYEHAGLYLINSHNGYTNVKCERVPPVDVEKDYPSVFEWLSEQNRISNGGLEKRTDKGVHWTNLRNCAYIEDFEKSKILYSEFGYYYSGVYDFNGGLYLLDTAHFIKSEVFLLAILNSTFAKWFMHLILPSLGEKGMRFKPTFVEQIPIAVPTSEQKLVLENLVEQIAELKHKLGELEKSAISLLMANFGLKKEISLELGFNELLEEMVKQKVNLTLVQKEELQTWYKNKQFELNELKKNINDIDRQIDELVYKLYGLDEKEIGLIEGEKN